MRILDEIDTQVQRYLLATVGANALVALFTWLAFEALGMEQAGVWGVAAGILHFIPYLGPVLFAIASGVAGFMQIRARRWARSRSRASRSRWPPRSGN